MGGKLWKIQTATFMEVSIGVAVQHTKIVMNKSAVIVARLNNATPNPRQ